jgi:hypothetical protein
MGKARSRTGNSQNNYLAAKRFGQASQWSAVLITVEHAIVVAFMNDQTHC